MKVQKIALILGIVVLSGCQQIHQTRAEYIRDRSQDYLRSHLIAPIRVPEGLSPLPESAAYPLPTNIPPVSSLKPVSVVPPGFGTLSESSGARDVY